MGRLYGNGVSASMVEALKAYTTEACKNGRPNGFLESMVLASASEHQGIINNHINKLFPIQSKPNRDNRKDALNHVPHYNVQAPIKGKRSSRYKKAQQLFNKNRHYLTTKILENQLDAETTNEDPPIATVEKHYKSLFSFQPESPTGEPTINNNETYEPAAPLKWITEDEIAQAKIG